MIYLRSLKHHWLRMVVFLGFCACLLPTGACYSITILMIGSLLFYRSGPGCHYQKLSTPLHWGVLALFAVSVGTALVSPWASGYGETFYDVFKAASHQGFKRGLLWFVIWAFLGLAGKRQVMLQTMGRPLCCFFGVYFFYCLLQRYTGIDLVHGFAVLEDHRFAYGVYRVSGLMGHPLTLAYNAVLVAIVAAGMAFWHRSVGDIRECFWWSISFGFLAGILLVSGSRAPVAVFGIVGLLFCLTIWRRHLWWVVIGALVFAVLLWWEGSLIGRISELFNQNLNWQQKFPRLVFWHVHGLMFADHPWLGVGQPVADVAVLDYYTKAGYTNIETKYSAHNIFLQTLADSGMIGAVGLGIFLGAIGKFWRRHRGFLGGNIPGALLMAVNFSGLLQNNLKDSEFLFALYFTLSVSATMISQSLPSRRGEV